MASSRLSSIPCEIREKILLMSLPAVFHLKLNQETSTFQHTPLPLLDVSHTIRAETLDLLQRHIVIQLSSPEALGLVVPEQSASSNSFLPACPRHLHIRVLHPLTVFIESIPNDQQDAKLGAPHRPYVKSLIDSWACILAWLPPTTKSLVLDFSHSGYSIRANTLGGLVQRVSTRLFIVNRGKTKVEVKGCNTKYGQLYLEGCIPGSQPDHRPEPNRIAESREDT